MTKPWRNITTIWSDKKNCVFVFISVNLTGGSTDDPHACNTFEEPNLVRAKPVKANSKVAKQHEFELPSASVTTVTFSLC